MSSWVDGYKICLKRGNHYYSMAAAELSIEEIVRNGFADPKDGSDPYMRYTRHYVLGAETKFKVGWEGYACRSLEDAVMIGRWSGFNDLVILKARLRGAVPYCDVYPEIGKTKWHSPTLYEVYQKTWLCEGIVITEEVQSVSPY